MILDFWHLKLCFKQMLQIVEHDIVTCESCLVCFTALLIPISLLKILFEEEYGTIR